MNSPSSASFQPLSAPDRKILELCAEDVRESLAGSRSDKLERLFEYLLEKTLAGEASSEQQINAEAFAADVDPSARDSKVRVYVHRLRKLLETVFDDPAEPSLKIPVGEYRLCVEHPADDAEEVTDTQTMEAGSPSKPVAWKRIVPAAALVALVLALGASVLLRERAPLADTAFWQPVVEDGRPLTVVMGDYYAFSRLDRPATAPGQGPRLVWDRAVPTREDLTILQMLEPDGADNLVDYNQHFVTGGTLQAVSAVRTALSRLPGAGRRQVSLVPISQLTPERLVSDDIVFVGQFSGIGTLIRDPLLQASGFRFGPQLDGLIDSEGEEVFLADNMNLTDERTPRRDFAYIASLPGPAGNRLMVVAGIGDAGVKQAAELVSDRDQLESLAAAQGGANGAFEALFRVRTVQNVNVGASLLVSRSLQAEEIWDSSASVPEYRPIPPAVQN